MHTLMGQVDAIQWVGTNLDDIKTKLGTGWGFWTSSTSTSLAMAQVGNEWNLGKQIVPLNGWLVSLTAYGDAIPTVANGFFTLSADEFAQQYSG